MAGRRNIRVPVRVAVEVLPDDGRVLAGMTRDVSLGGVAVDMDPALADGVACTVRILTGPAGRGGEVNARAVVRREGPPYVAFQFTTVDANDFDELKRLLLSSAKADERLRLELEDRNRHPPLASLGALP